MSAALELTQGNETLRLRHVPRLVHEHVSEVSMLHLQLAQAADAAARAYKDSVA